MSPVLGGFGAKTDPEAAAKRPALLSERDRGPGGLLASPGGKTPSKLWFVTTSIRTSCVQGQRGSPGSSPCRYRWWGWFQHLPPPQCGNFSVCLPGGLGGAGTVWEVKLYLIASKKAQHPSSASFPLVFGVVPGAAAGGPASLCPCFWLRPGEQPPSCATTVHCPLLPASGLLGWASLLLL